MKATLCSLRDAEGDKNRVVKSKKSNANKNYFRGKHDVLGAGLLEQFSPFLWLVKLCRQLRGKLLVCKARLVVLLHERLIVGGLVSAPVVPVLIGYVKQD